MFDFFYSTRSVGAYLHHRTVQWRHNGHDGVSSHQPHDCLLKRLFRRRSNTKAPRHWPFVRGIHRWPHKGPVTRKMFPFDDAIMLQPIMCHGSWSTSVQAMACCLMLLYPHLLLPDVTIPSLSVAWCYYTLTYCCLMLLYPHLLLPDVIIPSLIVAWCYYTLTYCCLMLLYPHVLLPDVTIPSLIVAWCYYTLT